MAKIIRPDFRRQTASPSSASVPKSGTDVTSEHEHRRQRANALTNLRRAILASTNLTPTEKLVALALAEFRNRDWFEESGDIVAYPGPAKIGHILGTHEDYVRACRTRLHKSGAVDLERRRGGSKNTAKVRFRRDWIERGVKAWEAARQLPETSSLVSEFEPRKPHKSGIGGVDEGEAGEPEGKPESETPRTEARNSEITRPKLRERGAETPSLSSGETLLTNPTLTSTQTPLAAGGGPGEFAVRREAAGRDADAPLRGGSSAKPSRPGLASRPDGSASLHQSQSASAGQSSAAHSSRDDEKEYVGGMMAGRFSFAGIKHPRRLLASQWRKLCEKEKYAPAEILAVKDALVCAAGPYFEQHCGEKMPLPGPDEIELKLKRHCDEGERRQKDEERRQREQEQRRRETEEEERRKTNLKEFIAEVAHLELHPDDPRCEETGKQIAWTVYRYLNHSPYRFEHGAIMDAVRNWKQEFKFLPTCKCLLRILDKAGQLEDRPKVEEGDDDGP